MHAIVRSGALQTESNINLQTNAKTQKINLARLTGRRIFRTETVLLADDTPHKREFRLSSASLTQSWLINDTNIQQIIIRNMVPTFYEDNNLF